MRRWFIVLASLFAGMTGFAYADYYVIILNVGGESNYGDIGSFQGQKTPQVIGSAVTPGLPGQRGAFGQPTPGGFGNAAGLVPGLPGSSSNAPVPTSVIPPVGTSSAFSVMPDEDEMTP